MKSAITICLVPEAARGPFVFHEGLSSGCEHAADAGFHAVEVFPPNARNFPKKELEGCLKQTSLKLAAVGTGAGWLKQRLSLTDTDPNRRQEAIQFVSDIIDLASEFDAPAIIGSMQGQASDINHRSDSLHLLADGLSTLGDRAMQNGQVLLYEALNRYETDLLNTQEDAANFLIQHDLVNKGVRLLCDLFHMNIEEASIAEGLRTYGRHIGHVHFVDSNRRPAGCGHMDYAPIAAALKEIGYDKYASAEAFPWPDSNAAAQATVDAFKQHLA